MKALGIDVGSTIAKFAVLDLNSNVQQLFSYRVNGDPVGCVAEAYASNDILKECDVVGVTGSSRNLIAEHINAYLTKPEILAHVYGVWSQNIVPDMIIEIGGQDSKLILLKDNVIVNFRMNSNCAAGTGAFIESQARRCGISVTDMDSVACNNPSSLRLNAKCATFLESALIDLQRKGVAKKDSYMAIFHSLSKNYVSSLCQDVDFNKYRSIAFIGGVAKFKAMKQCLEEEICKQIFVPDNCEYMGAIGMARLVADRSKVDQDETNDANKSNMLNIIQCQECKNRCLLSGVMLADGSVFYEGGLCGKHTLYVAKIEGGQ